MTSTAVGRPATAGMPGTVETSTTLLVSAGTPTTIEVQEKVKTPTTHEFLRTFSRNSPGRRKIREKDTKVLKFKSRPFFYPIDFSQFYKSVRLVRLWKSNAFSPLVEVQ
jgi:hypothetical protein